VVSAELYGWLVLGLAVERGFELLLSRSNAAWARARGAIEYGRGHLRWMKALHAGFLLSCVAEVWLGSRPFVPALGWPCLGLVLASQALRYWTIATLGRRWNVAVLVLPGVPAEARGPFRFVKHPNYLSVVVEGLAMPLVHTAFLTALGFTLLNAWLLTVRIRCEERALGDHCAYAERLRGRRRLWPVRSSRT
jgi:methyltransferase